MTIAPSVARTTLNDIPAKAVMPAAGLRVLFVSFDIRSRFGGIQRFDQRVVRCLGQLRDRGADVRVLSLRDATFVGADDLTPIDIQGSAGSKPKAAAKPKSAAKKPASKKKAPAKKKAS